MIEELRAAIGPYYLYIKAVHVVSAAIWGFSTAVAWSFYVKPVVAASRRRPESQSLHLRRNDFMERFERGAWLEHVAFLLLVLTAALLLWIGQVDLTRWSFITLLLWLGILVILPMEVLDIHLSHMGGNKRHLRAAGDAERYERMLERH